MANTTFPVDGHGTFGDFAFKFVPGKDYRMFVQVWLKDAMFSVMKQAWFDNYAYRFKGDSDYQELPEKLKEAINYTFIATFNPERKDFRKKD